MSRKAPYGTIEYNGITVPLTKEGLPNLVFLPKELREVVKQYATQKKKTKQQVLMKELEELLKKLG
jgi:hypothetical protein